MYEGKREPEGAADWHAPDTSQEAGAKEPTEKDFFDVPTDLKHEPMDPEDKTQQFRMVRPGDEKHEGLMKRWFGKKD